MRLNLKTDYALRILLHAAKNQGSLITSTEVAKVYNITQANSTQIVNTLKKKGYLIVKRGRYGGGFTLAAPPEEMRIGNIIKDIEPDLNLVQCFNKEKNNCPIIDNCKLAGLMYSGLNAFLDKMNEQTLADII
ncbi:Rrf2 family transcriptional regulator [Lentisphaera profundi]|uniref:Rrf2 family transcriptional regulator n=1 Tax=Lentisphaera profundi TaxID=1658616 RepID=A0ABY7VVZ4_9BACT|nr:Rrf2 family transcriptional regulator [Lentisphaera profundi]WDE98385.1 Rrf2 family transcriptional regulator [Lentisphaera profundi]